MNEAPLGIPARFEFRWVSSPLKPPEALKPKAQVAGVPREFRLCLGPLGVLKGMS